MNYEKKYKEALSRARQFSEHPLQEDSDSIVEYIFPELAESEDEKVRKALAEMVHDTTGDELWVDYNVHKEEALAWLEKQGEKKPQRMISAEAKEAMYGKPAWSEKDEQHIDSLLKRLDGLCRNEFERTRFAISEDRDWLTSLKERIE